MVTVRPSALVVVASNDGARRARFAAVISARGYEPLEAADSGHALALATRYLPDVVVADSVLAITDGSAPLVDLLAHAADTHDTPAVIIAPEAEHDLGERLEKVLAQRTNAAQGSLTLRRALADIRASAAAAADPHRIANAAGNAMISVLVADDNARYVEANDAVCALTGYSRSDLLGMSIWDLTPDYTMDEGRRMWARFRQVKRSDGTYRLRRHSGEIVTIRFAAEADMLPGLHVSAMAPLRLLSIIKN